MSARHPDRQQQITRRAFVFGGASVAAISVLVGRLYYLQFIRADKFTTLAEDNRVKIQLMPPVRGTLNDRNGVPMATNEKNFRLFLDADAQRNVRTLLTKLNEIIPISEERIKLTVTQAKTSRYQPPILVKEHLTWDEVSQFEFFAPNYPGIFVDVGQVRYYPFNDQASHLIGYVGAVAEDEMTDQPLLRLPDFKIGKSGVEKMLEQDLRGTAGVKHIEVNVHNLPVRELSTRDGVPGKDTRLTIDSRLQQFVSERIAGESAAVVVMNVHNGDVLALVSMPAFDPNRFSKGISNDYWKELQANEKNPLLNKAVAGQYPPGSTFKMAVGLAALKEELATPDTHVYCPGHFMLGNHQFNCWKAGGHGSVNLHHALAESCDTYFYTMAQRLGIDRLASAARLLGMGSMPGLGLVGEKPGLIPDDAWKRARYNDAWRPGDTINVGIGQGYVLATPLQLAVMTSRLVNGGREVKPRLVRPEGEEDVQGKALGFDPEHLAAIMDGMNAVTGQPYGTAYAKRITDPLFPIGGKTGTSQVRKIFQRGVNQDTLPWRFRHHALYVCYGPVPDPKYAAAVIVEHGGGGSAAAAPVAKDVMNKLKELVLENGPPAKETHSHEFEKEKHP